MSTYSFSSSFPFNSSSLSTSPFANPEFCTFYRSWGSQDFDDLIYITCFFQSNPLFQFPLLTKKVIHPQNHVGYLECVSPYGYPGLTWFVEPQFPPSQLELLRLELIRFLRSLSILTFFFRHNPHDPFLSVSLLLFPPASTSQTVAIDLSKTS